MKPLYFLHIAHARSFYWILVVGVGLFLCLPGMGQTPSIQSLGKQRAGIQEEVIINGSGFGSVANTKVYFGAAQANVTEVNGNSVKAQVPAGATFAPVTVVNTSSRLSAQSPTPFSPAFGGRPFTADQLSTPIHFSANTSFYDLQLSDLDGDGLNDVVTTHTFVNTVSIYHNTSTLNAISFSKSDLTVGGYTQAIVCGDLDSDGKPDLLLSGFSTHSNKLYFVRNLSTPGNISFDTPIPFTLSSNGAGQLALRDLNGDGQPEIVMTNHTNQTANQVSIFLNQSNQGAISFNPNPLFLSISELNSNGISITDLDNDNKPEVIILPNLGPNVFIFHNQSSQGNIQFASPIKLPSPAGNTLIMCGDIDGDQKPDITVTNIQNNYVSVWLNQTASVGSIQFGSMKTFGTDLYPHGIQLNDIDGDGKNDVLIGHTQTGSVAILKNSSTQGSPQLTKTSILGLEKNRNVRAGDLNGDGKPDILYNSTASSASNKLSVLQNRICVEAKLSPEGQHEFCEGTPFTLSTQQAEGLSYEWKVNGTIIAEAASHELDITQSGEYTVTITDAIGGCSSTSAAVLITIEAGTTTEQPEFYPISPACEGEALTLSAKPIDGATYTWTGPNGFSRSGNAATIYLENVSPEMEGTYQLQLEIGPCRSLMLTQFADILPKPQPVITYSGSTTLCANEPLSLVVEGGFNSYQWKKDGVAISGANQPNYSTAEPGSYTVVVGTQNCSNESQAVVLSRGNAPEAGFETSGVSCVNQEVSFTNSTSTSGSENVLYFWNFGDGTTSTDRNPSHVYTSTQGSPYTVTLTTRYSNSSCEDSFTQTIEVIESTDEVILEALSSTEFCLGESTELQISGDVQGVSWSTGETAFTIEVSDAGTYVAEVLTTSGCTVSRSITINTLPAPELEVSADKQTLKLGEQAQLQASGGIRYEWSPATGLSDPSIPNPIARPSSTTTYTVTTWGENGCTASTEITITLDSEVHLETPKIFIPSQEDYWKVGYIENYPELSLSIMNRFGKTIFSASPYQNQWDGRDNGNQLNDGVYYYVFKNPQGNIVKTGTITIIQ